MDTAPLYLLKSNEHYIRADAVANAYRAGTLEELIKNLDPDLLEEDEDEYRG